MSNTSINGTGVQAFNCNDGLIKAIFAAIDKFETPLFFVVGFFSRLICLASIYRERKAEKAYYYQIYVQSAEAAEILFYFLFQLARTFTSPFRTNASWFQRCYACMWWSARLSNTLTTASRTNTNLLTLAMSLDRAYAVLRPTKYAHLPHTTIRKVIPFVTIIFSVGIDLPASFLFGLNKVGDSGMYVQIEAYSEHGSAYTFFYQLSAAFDLALLIANILANILLCYGFREAMRARAGVTNDASLDDQRWRTLFKMTLCQSLWNTLASLSGVAYRLFSSYVTSYTGILYYTLVCLAAPFNTAFVELTDIAEFCCIMAVSKKFRSMVIGTVKRMFEWKWHQNQVIDIRVG